MIGSSISHYRIDRRLGAGGMGEVFLARDLALGRLAAVKVLPQGFQEDLRVRLLREAQAAARLQHPGIATFFEAGEDRGITFVAMEYVEGETLRSVLRRGPLPREHALRVAAGLLEALNHAHAAGVVHRDIKPENVMITSGGAGKILDFGLALRLLDDPGGAGPEETPTRTVLTTEGTILGSPGYMAPEQWTGAPVGPATDLFAVGAVVYEMLVGRAAFPGATLQARFAATLTLDPPPLDAECADLDPILRKALARETGKRYARAADFLRDLRAVSRGEAVSAYPDALVVFDLRNRSGRPEEDWIGCGIAESLSADLARFEGLSVAPRAKVARAIEAGGGSDPLLGARRLGCRWAISGSFQRAGERIRVVLELADASTEKVVTTEKVDGRADDLFAIQDRLAERVRAALDLRERSGGTAARKAAVVGAYENLVRAKQLWLQFAKGSFDEAEDLLHDALRRQPDYADAHAQLAALHDMRFTFTTDPAELARAEEHARRAIEAAPGDAEAHVWLGYSLWRQERAEEALAVLDRAAALDPGSGYAPYFSGCVLHSIDLTPEAVPRFQRAVELTPAFGFAWVALGHAHTENGNLAEAAWTYEKGIDLEKAQTRATAGAEGYLAECLRRLGRLGEARARCLTGLESVDRTDHMYRDTYRAVCLLNLGRVAWDQGDGEGARAAFAQCSLHLNGRPRTLGGGFLGCRALAGQALASGDVEALAKGVRRLRRRDEGNWSWLFGCSRNETVRDLVRAAEALGRRDLVLGF